MHELTVGEYFVLVAGLWCLFGRVIYRDLRGGGSSMLRAGLISVAVCAVLTAWWEVLDRIDYDVWYAPGQFPAR
jgi:hypothetical protein